MVDDPRVTEIRQRWDGLDWSSKGNAVLGQHATKDIPWLLDQLASVSEGLANLQKEHEMLRASEPFTASGTTGSPRSPQPEGSVLSALRQRLEPVARREHYQAVGASALFSVEHWKHNAGPEWPHEPDDDSFTAFENCKHPLCAAVRPDDPVRIGAFDYTENADGTITRKDWRQP